MLISTTPTVKEAAALRQKKAMGGEGGNGFGGNAE